MALSGRGIELCPPGLVVSNRKLATVFSPTCIDRTERVPSGPTRPPPPSLSAYSASINSRRFLASHPAPLKAVDVYKRQGYSLQSRSQDKDAGKTRFTQYVIILTGDRADVIMRVAYDSQANYAEMCIRDSPCAGRGST